MIINNFEQVSKFLVFESDDWFYHLQILKRKKDCLEHEKRGNNNARNIKSYYITSVDQLLKLGPEIIALCEMFTARAYINLNAKSFQKVAAELNVQVAIKNQRKEYNYLWRLFDTVTGGGYEEEKDEEEKILLERVYDSSIKVNVGQKRWIVDIDVTNIGIINKYIARINTCASGNPGHNVIDAIPTVNGYHLITIPFNLDTFHNECNKNNLDRVDIQKNNPTILYFNKKEND